MPQAKPLHGRMVCKKCYYGFANRRQLAYLLDIAAPNVSGAGGHIEVAKDSAVQILVPRDGEQPNDE